jgi:hypothetical protein
MDVNSRYIVVQASMAERHAEAARARLVKGDRFADARPIVASRVVAGRTVSAPRLLDRLAGLRSIVRRPLGAAAGSPAR